MTVPVSVAIAGNVFDFRINFRFTMLSSFYLYTAKYFKYISLLYFIQGARRLARIGQPASASKFAQDEFVRNRLTGVRILLGPLVQISLNILFQFIEYILQND